MDEEKKEQTELTAADYVAQLRELKEKTVSRDEYEKLRKENVVLAEAAATHFRDDESETKPEVDVTALRKRLFGGHHYKTDLEYFSDAIALRDALVEGGEQSPFLPSNREYSPSGQDMADEKNFADTLRNCVEEADGDASYFTASLKRCGAKPTDLIKKE